jgi:hypothetical protein
VTRSSDRATHKDTKKLQLGLDSQNNFRRKERRVENLIKFSNNKTQTQTNVTERREESFVEFKLTLEQQTEESHKYIQQLAGRLKSRYALEKKIERLRVCLLWLVNELQDPRRSLHERAQAHQRAHSLVSLQAIENKLNEPSGVIFALRTLA